MERRTEAESDGRELCQTDEKKEERTRGKRELTKVKENRSHEKLKSRKNKRENEML